MVIGVVMLFPDRQERFRSNTFAERFFADEACIFHIPDAPDQRVSPVEA